MYTFRLISVTKTTVDYSMKQLKINEKNANEKKILNLRRQFIHFYQIKFFITKTSSKKLDL